MNWKKWLRHNHHKLEAGFSLLEMLIVIGIIGILVGAGSVAYMNQLSTARVSSGVQIINANMRLARQQSIAMRQRRRVCIHAGQLTGFDESPKRMAGTRIGTEEPFMGRVGIWVEGKLSQEYYFSDKAWNVGQNVDNAYPTTDIEYFPDGLMIADVGGIVPGIDAPKTFYFEFDSRGTLSKIYFEGQEKTTTPNTIAPVIHVARDGEIIKVGDRTYDYYEFSNSANIESLKAGNEDARERYKVSTIEVIRLTGKTRIYNYGIFDPWPNDELIEDK